MDFSAAATQPKTPHSGSDLTPGVGLIFLAVVVGIMFALNLSAPVDLESTNEERASAFVLDLQQTGNWLCPRDAAGKLISKPPLYVWLASFTSWIGGGITPATLRFPSVIGLFLGAAAIWLGGRKPFGSTAALSGAVAFMLSPAAITQFAAARYDVLFAAFISLGAMFAFAAWNEKRSWIPFWLAAASATLVKGPLGLMVAGAGLLAVVWEKRQGDSMTRLSGSHWAGLSLFLVTTCGWFALAYREFGDALIERMITGELISHSVGTDEGLPGSRFWEPISNFASNFLPWSILAGIAFYRLWRHPATSVSERRLERFLFCWFMVGLIALSLASHQRARLILPILPPAALLAGRELARWADGKQFGWRLYLGVVAILLTGVGLYFHVAKPHADSAELTRDMREAARQSTSQSPHRYPLLHADSPFSFRYYRCELQPRITLDAAAEILRDPLPAFVAVRNAKRLEERFGSLPANVHEIFRWPTQTPRVHVFSNQPRSEEVTRFAFRIGSISADITGAEFVAADWSALTLRPGKTPAVVVLTNRGSSAIPMSVRFLKDTGSTKVGRELAPGEEWKLDASALLEQAAPSTRAQ